MKKEAPSMDVWLKEAKEHESAPKIGMYLTHNGIVRQTAKAQVRYGEANTREVTGMDFSYDQEKVDAVIADTYKMEGIYYIRVWLNEGRLSVGGASKAHVLERSVGEAIKRALLVKGLVADAGARACGGRAVLGGARGGVPAGC